MEVPGLGPFRRQREDTWKAAFSFGYGNGGTQARVIWSMPAAVAGGMRHLRLDLFQGFQEGIQCMPIIEDAPADTSKRNIRVFSRASFIQEVCETRRY